MNVTKETLRNLENKLNLTTFPFSSNYEEGENPKSNDAKVLRFKAKLKAFYTGPAKKYKFKPLHEAILKKAKEFYTSSEETANHLVESKGELIIKGITETSSQTNLKFAHNKFCIDLHHDILSALSDSEWENLFPFFCQTSSKIDLLQKILLKHPTIITVIALEEMRKYEDQAFANAEKKKNWDNSQPQIEKAKNEYEKVKRNGFAMDGEDLLQLLSNDKVEKEKEAEGISGERESRSPNQAAVTYTYILFMIALNALVYENSSENTINHTGESLYYIATEQIGKMEGTTFAAIKSLLEWEDDDSPFKYNQNGQIVCYRDFLKFLFKNVYVTEEKDWPTMTASAKNQNYWLTIQRMYKACSLTNQKCGSVYKNMVNMLNSNDTEFNKACENVKKLYVIDAAQGQKINDACTIVWYLFCLRANIFYSIAGRSDLSAGNLLAKFVYVNDDAKRTAVTQSDLLDIHDYQNTNFDDPDVADKKSKKPGSNGEWKDYLDDCITA